MCDWEREPPFNLMHDYKCPHKSYVKSKDGARNLCVFHSDEDDKDPELFYQGIRKIYESKKHSFRGFVFPRKFDFLRLKVETKEDHLVFTDADFLEAIFLCNVQLSEVEFTGQGKTDFTGARFTGKDRTDFTRAQFSSKGGTSFILVKFTGQGSTWFLGTRFTGHGNVNFNSATFSGQGVLFSGAQFIGEGVTSFSGATFLVEGEINFSAALFASKKGTFFAGVQFRGKGMINFMNTQFSSKTGTDFGLARFAGESQTNFMGAQFSGLGGATFYGVHFSSQGGILFSQRTFHNTTVVDFRKVTFENPDKVTFDGVDLNRVRFLWTDLTGINFRKVFWCGRKYSSSFYIGRNKVFDELLQERGRFIRYVQRSLTKTRIAKIPLRVVESLGRRIPKNSRNFFWSSIQKGYLYLLTWAWRIAVIKEEAHYEVYRLYNQLLENYENSNRYHEAGDFFAGMMEMRRRESFEKPRTRIALWFYRLFSLYGERPNLAFAWMVIFIIMFGLLSLNIGLYPVEPNSGLDSIERNVFSLWALGDRGFWKDYLQAIFVALKPITFGKIGVAYEVKDIFWGPLLRIGETISGAVFVSLFVLAMNRKFRRTKD
jgi:uncharacterized protein YjbI with pentapeptide repeats